MFLVRLVRVPARFAPQSPYPFYLGCFARVDLVVAIAVLVVEVDFVG